ncbi:hypothetical protein [Polymorphobacter fuscus]|uniref:Uncharacterized protein n=1 Tax=Sandarakinorhabdus fusca TaxID=1439888 RepID=A0A7C9KYM6_9SPHN|nr:hypothetical protein [Polymorphobacter fuscus]KAB7647861.1 hypothetical protein F9290_07820 [Polymorphobacter fuscus]MQT17168.1 hypothetical protein [Polymorphobacter fuscus]NJC08838.1 hypothetical protein [Polymorphobacter fuscus]
MPPLESLLVLSTASLAGIGLVGGFAAWGWGGWLRLRAQEIERDRTAGGNDLPAIGQRIDLADLKERIRKLEAIAAGVDF